MPGCTPEARAQEPPLARATYSFDVFLSTPLAALHSDAEIAEEHGRVQDLVSCLERDLSLRVYWAGRGITARADFRDAVSSARENAAALVDSRWFLLLYLAPLASSVLFEAGIALHACLRSVYVVRSRCDLPFLLRHADTAFENVALHEIDPLGEPITLIRRQGMQLFAPEPLTSTNTTVSP